MGPRRTALYKVVGAGGSRYEVHRELYSHRQTLIPISKRARSQRREAATVITVIPSPLHCITVSTASPLFTDRRCPCAAYIDEPDGGYWILHPCGLKFGTLPFLSLSLYRPFYMS